MKTLGIIGGIGPESTIDYYRRILEKSPNSPNIIINSIDVKRLLKYAGINGHHELTEYLLAEINKLKSAGVDLIILAANTPHIIFERLLQSVHIPMLSIVEETCKAVKATGVLNAGLIGTSFTMTGGFYQEAASKYGIDITLPDIPDQEFIHHTYVNEFIPGVFNEESKINLIRIIKYLINKKNIDALILGGTELSVILKQEDLPEIKVFDTTAIHVESVIKYMNA